MHSCGHLVYLFFSWAPPMVRKVSLLAPPYPPWCNRPLLENGKRITNCNGCDLNAWRDIRC